MDKFVLKRFAPIPAETEVIGKKVLDAAYAVHSSLGPGLLESAYQECLAYELSHAGVSFQKEWPLPVRYKDVLIDCGYRVDILVEQSLILELKSVDKLLPIHEAQILTYMKLASVKTGLLINFNVQRLTDGLKRMVL